MHRSDSNGGRRSSLKHRVAITAAITGLFLFSVSAASAEQESVTGQPATPTRLDPIVVSARGVARPVSLTPGGVGVIDAGQIEQRQSESLTDISRQIPGVEKSSDSPWGAEINIRGMGRNRVVFLVDGCRVNTATDINGQFGLVHPDDIERIEVLKGPISALYGSGSIGGVVNVITKSGAPTAEAAVNGEVVTRWGDNPSGMGVYANGSVANDRMWLFASGSYRDYDNREADGNKIPNSQYRDEHGKISGGYQWNPVHTTDFQLQHVNGEDIGIPGRGLALPVGPEATYTRINRTLGALTHTITPETGALENSTVKLYYQEIQRRVRLDQFPSAAPMASIEPEADHLTLGAKWTNRFALNQHELLLGFDAWTWRIDNTERTKTLRSGAVGIDSALGKVSQDTYGIFVEDDWRFAEGWTLNSGGRLDAMSATSDDLYNWQQPPNPAMTPTLKRDGKTEHDVSWQFHTGLTWQVTDAWSTTVLAASSYRAPDLMDRFKYINLGGGVELFGNPELDPERSLFFEYGLHFRSNRVRASAAAYANYLTDLIAEEVVSASVRQLENIDRAVIYGSEFDVTWWVVDDWALFADIAWTKGRNESEDEPLAFIAPLNGHVGLRYGDDRDHGFWLSAELEWAASQNDVPDNVVSSESWQTVNVYAGYRFAALGLDHGVTAGVTNLFDEAYSNHLTTNRGIDLKEPGIGFSCQYKMSF